MSWLPIIEEDDASGEVARLYERAREAYDGFVPDAVKALTPRPEVAHAIMGLKDVLLGEASTLGKRRADMVAAVVSGINRCEYCATAHVGVLTARGDLTADDASELYRNWRRLDLPEDERAMLAFAEKLTVEPSAVAEVDLARLRAAGFDDVQIYDIVMLVAYRNFINRVHDGLGVPLDRLQERFGNPLDVVANPARRE